MSRTVIEGKAALGHSCPECGAELVTVREEDHTEYGGGYYLYFLRCKNDHRWLRVITQYDEAPPVLMSGWEKE